MDLRQIRYFIAAAEGENIRQAAAKLGVTQPALSRQIMGLEKSLDVRLFERRSRGVRLTDAGRHFLRHSRRLVAEFDALSLQVRALEQGDAGVLRIGFVPTTTWSGALAALLDAFRRDHPNVRLELREGEDEALLDMLSSGDLDAVISRSVSETGSNSSAYPVEDEGVCLALAEGSALADSPPGAVGDLTGVSMILLQRPAFPVLYDGVMDVFSEARVRPSIAHLCRNEAELLAMVRMGQGVGLIGASAANRCQNGIVFVPIPDLQLRLHLFLVISTDRVPKPLEMLLEILSGDASFRGRPDCDLYQA